MIRRVNQPFRFLMGWPDCLSREGRDRRRGTFTGQCYQPLYPSETTRHPDAPSVIAARQRMKEGVILPRISDAIGSSSHILAET